MDFNGKKIEATIFDMDGTMFDTERLRFRMLQTASENIFGQKMSDQLLLDSLGLSAKSGEALAKKQYGANFPYKEIRKKADELEVSYVRTHGVPLKPRLLNVLERLKKSGVFIALATSSRRAIAEEYLLTAKIMRFFDVLVCGDEVKKGKPDPEIFLKAINELNCNPDSCLIFEDSSNGLIAAHASGGNPIYIKDIKDPAPDVKALAFKAYESMPDMLEELITCTPVLPVPKINEPFPQSIDSITAGIHGFGAIGGGYLAQIFSHWDGYTRPKKIYGATPNEIIRHLVNTFGTYSVRYPSLGYYQPIDHVEIIDMNNKEQMIQMYIESEIIGLSLPEQVIRLQAPLIADCLIERFKVTNKHLIILVVLNKLNGSLYVKKQITNALKKKTDEKIWSAIISNLSICETVVNRMVSKIQKKEMLHQVQTRLVRIQKYFPEMEKGIQTITEEDFILKNTKEFKETAQKSPEEFSLFFNELGNLLNYAQMLAQIRVTLYNSEPDMPLYTGGQDPLLRHLRQIIVVDNINRLQEIKNKLSNGTHAILAWYSALLGYKSIGQGMGDEKVLMLVWEMMHSEIKPPLLRENSDLRDYINSFVSKFIERCRGSFKDPCKRVGRDPLRKLQNGERIFGTIKLAQKYNIKTPYLEFGAACGLLYAIRLINPEDKESHILHDLYNQTQSIQDLLTWTGNYNGKPYKGLDPEEDAKMISRIEKQFIQLNKAIPVSQKNFESVTVI